MWRFTQCHVHSLHVIATYHWPTAFTLWSGILSLHFSLSTKHFKCPYDLFIRLADILLRKQLPKEMILWVDSFILFVPSPTLANRKHLSFTLTRGRHSMATSLCTSALALRERRFPFKYTPYIYTDCVYHAWGVCGGGGGTTTISKNNITVIKTQSLISYFPPVESMVESIWNKLD